jgi:hypothetical protein
MYDVASLIVGVGVLAAVIVMVADTTILNGHVPNVIAAALWSAFVVFVGATSGFQERLRSVELREEAPKEKLEYLSEDHTGLPDTPPGLIPGGTSSATNVMRATVDDRRVFMFESSVWEDDRWWDGEPSRHSLSCALVELGGLLPRFHMEVRAATMKRLRGEWPKPTRRLDVELTRRVELAAPTIEVGEMTERLWTGVFNGSMRDWLETIGLGCHIRVDGGWVLCFCERQEGWIRRHDTMDAALGFAQRVPPSVFADVSTGHDAIR